VFGSDDEESEVVGPLAHEMRASSNTSHRGASDEDNILWSRWDKLRGVDGAVYNMRRLLFLGYSTGLQIWDCTNLASVTEILSLSGSDWERVKFAGVLPAPSFSKFDPFASQRPLITWGKQFFSLIDITGLTLSHAACALETNRCFLSTP
jgi:hypothetical protein